MSEWMTIATAPKDGTAVLLTTSNGKNCADGYFLASAYNGSGAWIWPYVYRTPIHWRPLPEAPK